MEMESLKKLKSTVEKCIEELSKKPDLTPAETKAALDGMQLRDILCMEIEECQMKESTGDDSFRSYGYGYSGVRSVPRHYTMTAYGRDDMGSSDYSGQRRNALGQYSVNGSHNGPMYGESMAMGRGYYGDNPHDYSRHSVGDRAVEKLENLMDTAKSEYEREELLKFIRMIRQAAD